MNILLIGPPGSGKGTQGERLARRLNVEHIAAGELLRAQVTAGTELGQRIAGLLERGELVSDSVVIELLMPAVIAAAARNGYVLDGFPRSVRQADRVRHLADEAGAAPEIVVYLDVPRSELIRRILSRAEVERRADDNIETVENRLRVFEQATRPLIDYYRERGLLRVVDAAREQDAVTAAILAVLDSIR